MLELSLAPFSPSLFDNKINALENAYKTLEFEIKELKVKMEEIIQEREDLINQIAVTDMLQPDFQERLREKQIQEGNLIFVMFVASQQIKISDLQAGIWFGSVALSPIITYPPPFPYGFVVFA